MTVKALIAAIAFISCVPTVAAKNLALEANGARAHDTWGGEIGVGYNLTFGVLTLRPAAGAFIYHGVNDRYYRDQLSNGQSRCRDRQNGQFAETSDCNSLAAKAYGRVEATFTLPASIEFGAGARFSEERVRAYGTASLPLAPMLRLKANAGDRYFAIGVLGKF